MCMETNLFEYFGLDREDSDRVFIIAEMSANHNHDFNIAVETVKAAKVLVRMPSNFKPIRRILLH